MPSLEIAGLTVFILMLFAGLYATVLGLPGTVIIFLNVFFYALVEGFEKIDFKVLLLLVILAVAAEAFGFLLEVKSPLRLFPTVRGIVASFLGALLGVLVLTPWLWGLGALLGMLFGGLTGLLITELISQSRLKPAHRASPGVIMVAVSITCMKGILAMLMTIVALTHVYS